MNRKNPFVFLPYFDLATEAHEALRGEKNVEIEGVKEEVEEEGSCRISKITILNEAGAAKMNRPVGRYITLNLKNSREETEESEIIYQLSRLLKELIPPKQNAPILVCGIGNPEIAADALGDKVISLSLPTRHLFNTEQNFSPTDFVSVALLAPNVLGNTGIEALELIQAVVKEINAAAVIVIDALATSSFQRLGASFQITDAGLAPGGGIGNKRPPINEETLKVPTIAMGVPTVIYPQAIIGEVFSMLREELCGENETAASQGWDAAENKLSELLEQQIELYAVTPKNIDDVVNNLAELLSAAVLLALHPGITRDNYREYLYL